MLESRYATRQPLTAAFEKCHNDSIGHVRELPDASTQGNSPKDRKSQFNRGCPTFVGAHRELTAEQFFVISRETEGLSGSETSRGLQF